MRHLQSEDKRKILFAMMLSACDDLPKYSAGDILYAVIRKLARKSGNSASFLREISNEDLYMEADNNLSMEISDTAIVVSKTNRKKKKK